MALDDQSYLVFSEVVHEAVQTYRKFQGLSSTPWRDLTEVQREAIRNRWRSYITIGVTVHQETDTETALLESGVIARLITNYGVTATFGDHAVFQVQPSSEAPATPIAPSPVVRIANEAGTAIAGFTSNVTVRIGQASAAGVLGGTKTVAAVAGNATFADLTISLAGTYTLIASVGGIDVVESAAFTIA